MIRRVSLLMLAVVAAGAAPVRTEEKAVALFDGRTLSGWTHFLVEPGARMEDVWRVDDGVLVCKGTPLGFLMTREKFTSFRLVVEWRWAQAGKAAPEKLNSGVLMRINGEPHGVPRAYEAQLRSGDAGDLYGFWGMRLQGAAERARQRKGDPNLGDMSGVTKAAAAENPIGEWNRYEIVLDGTRLTASVNGRKVNEASVADVVPGAIGLQSEGGEIHFRRVELTRLP